MNLNIHNYEILNFPSYDLLVSRRGISKINSPSLSAALSQLQGNSNISQAHLNEVLVKHGLDSTLAYEFLEKALFINNDLSNLYFEKTVVATDWEESSNLKSLLKSEVSTPLDVCKISDSLQNYILGKRCYLVILCERYDYDFLKKLYFYLAGSVPECAISICYRAGDTFCLSQPYLPRIGNPCHFCSVDRLINYEGYRETKNHWSKLLRFCKGEHIAVPANPLSLLQQSLVVGSLIKKIKLFSGLGSEGRYQDNILQETLVDLNSSSVREVSISHWYMCDCLRGKK